MKSKLYSPYQISRMSDAEIRKAYSDLRSVANKRLGRLEAQGLNQTARTGYRFPTIKQVEASSKSTIASELADVSVWLRDERSTIRGEKAFLNEFTEIMKEKGYGDIIQSYDDAYNFFDFMDDVTSSFYYDDIMVFTPKGRGIILPKGATALDFAFEIHSRIGEHAQYARINGKLSSVKTVLKRGD